MLSGSGALTAPARRGFRCASCEQRALGNPCFGSPAGPPKARSSRKPQGPERSPEGLEESGMKRLAGTSLVAWPLRLLLASLSLVSWRQPRPWTRWTRSTRCVRQERELGDGRTGGVEKPDQTSGELGRVWPRPRDGWE